MLGIKTILFPTDFSRQAASAYQFACALARDYNAKLIIAHIKEPPIVVVGEFGAPPPEPMPTDEALRDELLTLQPAAIAAEHVLVTGEPASEIVRLAAERGCDLIVMGTHGRRGLGRLVMGSVAEQVMRKAPCPVLTVKLPVVHAAEVEAVAAAAV